MCSSVSSPPRLGMALPQGGGARGEPVLMRKIEVALLAVALCAAGCAYHVAGKSDVMPQTIHTIAITPFANRTIQYKLAQRLPADITREFISRTRYKVVTD